MWMLRIKGQERAVFLFLPSNIGKLVDWKHKINKNDKENRQQALPDHNLCRGARRCLPSYPDFVEP